jgi:carbamoyltransferase
MNRLDRRMLTRQAISFVDSPRLSPQQPAGRFEPRHPLLGKIGARLAAPIAGRFFQQRQLHCTNSDFAATRARKLAAKLARGETAYLAGISIGGFHNSGVALVELSPMTGLRMICNNEEERFCGRKHASQYPLSSLNALSEMMHALGVRPEQIVAWLGTYDYPLLVATGIRSALEEFPVSLHLMVQDARPTFDADDFREGIRAPARLGELFGEAGGVPIVGMPHHDNHAYFSYLASPFAFDVRPVMVAVVDGSGDFSSISLYVGTYGSLGRIRTNGSMFDSLGLFYSVISSTQGGWTVLSSEGRYMGAAAYGDMNRSTNRYYPGLRNIFSLCPDGDVRLNRALANWHRRMVGKPYTSALANVLGPPIAPNELWNPDAVLRVEDIRHRPNTQDRVDKAAATQMVFEDALIHIIDCLIRTTGSERLVLTGGAALNAVANMRLLEHFDQDYYSRVLGRASRLHLWVPPIPGDAGAPVGAAYAFAARAGAGFGLALKHAFYCGRGSAADEILAALRGASDLAWMIVGNAARASGIEAIADLMAFITAQDGIFAIVQGPAETGPRALGHRSILANACNPSSRDLLNERVKHREAIRPLAPMMTLAAARELFELSDGAAEDDYNAYNYMVLTVRAKACARQLVPAVIHADGTARIQIVRAETDPITHAYLKALGRRVGVEIAVNTSFNVAAPIAQTPVQALETLRRANGLDAVLFVADDGPVVAVWAKEPRRGIGGRIQGWVADWQLETGATAAA